MPTKKIKATATETTSILTNNVDRITTTAKSINTQVLDTVTELVADTKNNRTQVTAAASTALKNIKITDSLKKISTTAVNINTEILETATEVLADVLESTRTSIGKIDLKIDLNVGKNVKKLQKAVNNTNEFVADKAEILVEDTLKSGEKWQALLAKTLGHGTTLLGKQQEIALDTTEALIGQYKTGSVRVKKLMGINFTPDTSYFKGQADKAVSFVKEAKDKAVASVDELLDGAFDKIKDMADVQKTSAKVKKATKAVAVAEEAILDFTENVKEVIVPVGKTAKKAKKVKNAKINKAKKATKKAAASAKKSTKKVLASSKIAKTTKQVATASPAKVKSAVKEVVASAKTATKTAAKTAKKVAAKTITKAAKKTATKTTVKAATKTAARPTAKASKKIKVATTAKVKTSAIEDLKIIEGIGPKIEELLNKAGITTYKQLATTDASAIKEILLAAGNRYKLHDPTTWAQQAELASAGKWEVLTVWKSRLKGGKASNQVSRIVTL